MAGYLNIGRRSGPAYSKPVRSRNVGGSVSVQWTEAHVFEQTFYSQQDLERYVQEREIDDIHDLVKDLSGSGRARDLTEYGGWSPQIEFGGVFIDGNRLNDNQVYEILESWWDGEE